ncbi:HDOD domain-containing protein [Pseudoxanthomonas mexicana]|uniref:HDOD domain-containing protein n=1 Tax=Pseudoxanthomonas mexicana TaxID=128785 RepID=UPI0012EE718B|nr:HDOD domain-containing protein [Pseudoxanthomonas mexicana]
MTGWWKRGPAREPAVRVPVAAIDVGPVVRMAGTAVSRDWSGPLLRMAGVDATTRLSAEQSAALVAATKRALVRFADDPQRLPRRPQLLPQLLSTLNDDEASSRDIAGIIARDPALAANLLKLANSALYRSQAAPVDSLDRAVAMVGVDGLRHLVSVALMQPVMRLDGGVFGRLPDLIWDHTQRTALLASQAARPAGREDVFAAQLLSLLQGLGAIVVVQVLRDTCAQADAGLPDADAIARLLRRWSPRLGRAVAREWALSDRLMQALDDQVVDEVAAMSALGRCLALAAPAASVAMESADVADAA